MSKTSDRHSRRRSTFMIADLLSDDTSPSARPDNIKSSSPLFPEVRCSRGATGSDAAADNDVTDKLATRGGIRDCPRPRRDNAVPPNVNSALLSVADVFPPGRPAVVRSPLSPIGSRNFPQIGIPEPTANRRTGSGLLSSSAVARLALERVRGSYVTPLDLQAVIQHAFRTAEISRPHQQRRSAADLLQMAGQPVFPVFHPTAEPKISSGTAASTTLAQLPCHGDFLGRVVKCRRNRTVFTDHHLNNLERSFERQKYLSTKDRALLASRLGLSQIQVKTWYQNRRMKWKKQVLQDGARVAPTKPKGRPRKHDYDDVTDDITGI